MPIIIIMNRKVTVFVCSAGSRTFDTKHSSSNKKWKQCSQNKKWSVNKQNGRKIKAMELKIEWKKIRIIHHQIDVVYYKNDDVFVL